MLFDNIWILTVQKNGNVLCQCETMYRMNNSVVSVKVLKTEMGLSNYLPTYMICIKVWLNALPPWLVSICVHLAARQNVSGLKSFAKDKSIN